MTWQVQLASWKTLHKSVYKTRALFYLLVLYLLSPPSFKVGMSTEVKTVTSVLFYDSAGA